MAEQSRMDELSKRLHACILVEKTAAKIYKKMAECFPDESVFFMELCHEEEDHAAILSMSKLYKMISKLPDEIVPHSIAAISESLSLESEILARLESDELSLSEALTLSLRLERSIAEEHLQFVLTLDYDNETINKLKKLQVETTTHADRISAMLNQKNLLS